MINPEGHQNPFSGSKVKAILLKGWIWPIGGVASGRVGACSLRSRLVYNCTLPQSPWKWEFDSSYSEATTKKELCSVPLFAYLPKDGVDAPPGYKERCEKSSSNVAFSCPTKDLPKNATYKKIATDLNQKFRKYLPEHLKKKGKKKKKYKKKKTQNKYKKKKKHKKKKKRKRPKKYKKKKKRPKKY